MGLFGNSTSKITSGFLCKNLQEFNKCLTNYMTNSTFIVAPLFDFVIDIEQRGLFLTDPDLDDQKLQPSMKTDTM